MELGALVAARIAVASSRQLARRGQSSATVVHAGAGTAASALWNPRMGKFQMRSRRNIPGVTKTRACPSGSFLCPARVSLTASTGAGPPPLVRPRPYCKAASLGVTEMCPVVGCELVTGLHRCHEAELIVVPDLAILHDVQALAADEDLALSFLYTVWLGKDVSTSAQLSAVLGRPRQLPLQHGVRHVPAIANHVTLFISKRFATEHARVHRVLRQLARSRGSNITVSDKDGVSASGGSSICTLRDVVAWTSSVRRVAHEMGRKALPTDGVAMPA